MAGAAPDPIDQAQQQANEVAAKLADLNSQLTTLSGKVAEAQHDLDVAQADTARGRKTLAAARQLVRSRKGELAHFAVQAYMSGGSGDDDPLAIVDGGSTSARVKDGYVRVIGARRQQLIDETAAAERGAKRHADDLDRAQHAAEDASHQLQADVAATQSALDAQTQLKSTIDARLAVLIAQRAATQAAGLNSADAADAAAARAGLAQAIATGLPPAPNPAAAIAVQAAMSKIGQPYVWGGSGPDVFDCSGLTMWSWAQAGVRLDHWTGYQIHQGTPVGLDQLQPGDLMFMWPPGQPAGPPEHVTMYIGNGFVIQAPHIGGVVEVTSMWWWPGASRSGVHVEPGH
jgi:cell wall-associated NlpC family hydrolase